MHNFIVLFSLENGMSLSSGMGDWNVFMESLKGLLLVMSFTIRVVKFGITFIKFSLYISRKIGTNVFPRLSSGSMCFKLCFKLTVHTLVGARSYSTIDTVMQTLALHPLSGCRVSWHNGWQVSWNPFWHRMTSGNWNDIQLCLWTRWIYSPKSNCLCP